MRRSETWFVWSSNLNLKSLEKRNRKQERLAIASTKPTCVVAVHMNNKKGTMFWFKERFFSLDEIFLLVSPKEKQNETKVLQMNCPHNPSYCSLPPSWSQMCITVEEWLSVFYCILPKCSDLEPASARDIWGLLHFSSCAITKQRSTQSELDRTVGNFAF